MTFRILPLNMLPQHTLNIQPASTDCVTHAPLHNSVTSSQKQTISERLDFPTTREYIHYMSSQSICCLLTACHEILIK